MGLQLIEIVGFNMIDFDRNFLENYVDRGSMLYVGGKIKRISYEYNKRSRKHFTEINTEKINLSNKMSEYRAFKRAYFALFIYIF